MSLSRQSVSCVAAFLVAVAAALTVTGETVVALQDDFSAYTSNEGVRAAWHNGNLFRGVSSAYDPSVPPSYMSNNNQPGYRVCDPVLAANRDWSVTDSYNRLYLVGNSTGYFDDVVVTTDVLPSGTLLTLR